MLSSSLTSALTIIAATCIIDIDTAQGFYAVQPMRIASTIKPTIQRTKIKMAGADDVASAVQVIDTFWQSSPYTAAALTCGFKASAADYVAQKRDYQTRLVDYNDDDNHDDDDDTIVFASTSSSESLQKQQKEDAAVVIIEEKEEEESNERKTDLQRNAAFLMYGAIYQGLAQEYIYNHLYPLLFGTSTTAPIVLAKVLFDLCIQTTLLTLPVAYVSKALIYKYTFREAFRRYWDDVRNHGLLQKYFALWGPVQCVTFSVVPVHYRVTFIAFVSFFWLIVLSSIASKSRTYSYSDSDSSSEVVVVVDGRVGGGKEKQYHVEECSLVDGQTCNIDG